MGTYPEVSLREARQARDEARALLFRGTNSKAHRKEPKLAARLADENTFGVVFSHWMGHRKREIKTGKGSTHAKIMRLFKKDILPFLGKQPIHEIRRPDLLEVIARIERRGALTMARSARGRLRQMFRYTLVKMPGLEYNHADYIEQGRRMMQDWADRLELFEQNQVERASRPLALHREEEMAASAAM